MKRALGIILALSLLTGVFAAEPVADVKVAEFTGNTSVKFGVDLDTGKTGFKNTVEASVKFNFFNSGEKSTTGDGIWGELVIKMGDPLTVKTDGYEVVPNNWEGAKVVVDVAKIHFGPVYMGIKNGEFGYGDGFKFPNALNYDNGGDLHLGTDLEDGAANFKNNEMKKFAKFTQGFVLGYSNDMFKVEAALRTHENALKSASTSLESSTAVTLTPTQVADGIDGEAGVVYVANSPNVDVSYDANTNKWEFTGGGAISGATVWKLTYTTDDDTPYWSNHYALGAYVETTPIDGLKIGAAVNYAISDAMGKFTPAVAPSKDWKLVSSTVKDLEAKLKDPTTTTIYAGLKAPTTSGAGAYVGQIIQREAIVANSEGDNGLQMAKWEYVDTKAADESYAYTSVAGDLGLFFGAQYKLPIGDMFTLEPVVAFNMYLDASKKKGAFSDFENGFVIDGDKSDLDGTTVTNKYDNSLSSSLGFGLRFGWGEEEDANSVLNDFFAKSLIYNQTAYKTDTDDDDADYAKTAGFMKHNNDEDKKLLPGVSVFTLLDFTKTTTGEGDAGVTKNIDYNLPLMITAYSGEIVPNLKVAGLFYANVASKAKTLLAGASGEQLLGALRYGVQGGIAVSYKIAVGDIAITPAFGILINSVTGEGKYSNVSVPSKPADFVDADYTGKATAIGIDFKTEITGLVPNTSFTVAWEDAAFTSYNTEFSGTHVAKTEGKGTNKGSMTISAKIAF